MRALALVAGAAAIVLLLVLTGPVVWVGVAGVAALAAWLHFDAQMEDIRRANLRSLERLDYLAREVTPPRHREAA